VSTFPAIIISPALRRGFLLADQREVDKPLFDKIGDSRFWARAKRVIRA